LDIPINLDEWVTLIGGFTSRRIAPATLVCGPAGHDHPPEGGLNIAV
jgi:hypothetical protein